MEVDQLRGQKLKINFDITFPSMSCSVVHLDVMDSGGKHQVRVASAGFSSMPCMHHSSLVAVAWCFPAVLISSMWTTMCASGG